jgi:glutathione peroxidase
MKGTSALIISALLVTNAAIAGPKIYEVPLKDIDGKDTTLKPYQGKVLLIVNVASKCGYTPQYTGLQALHEKYKDKGFSVLGFPSNDFGKQEPGSNAEIKEFCSSNFHVTFPMYDKIHVKGPEQHPLYQELTDKKSPFPGDVKWNFGKFLVGKDGTVLKRFDSGFKPDSAEMAKAIEEALAR